MPEVVAYTLRRNAGLSSGCRVSLAQMRSVICSAWSSDPALVTRLQMTERTHSRSAKAELEAQFPIQEQANQNLNWNRKRKEKREGAFVRDARRGGEEQVGGGEHEEGHVEPAPRKDVLLRLEAEAGDLGVGDLRTRVGPGEIRGEAHHGQHGLLLRRVHDRRHLGCSFAVVSRSCRRRRWRGKGRRRWV